MSSIVVGVDGSAGSEQALTWALEEAQRSDREVTAVAISTHPWAPAPVGHLDPPMSDEDLSVASGQLLEETVAEVVAAGSWAREPSTLVRPGGRVGSALCDEATGSALLVVGQRGGGGFLGLRLGSVSEYCLHHSPVTLAIVPEVADPVPPPRITVGVDGSEDSIRALRWAVDDGGRRQIPVVALMAWSWISPGVQDIQPTIGWDEEHASDLLDAVLADHDVPSTVGRSLVNDQPAPALIARSEAGDQVVVGAQGQSAVLSAIVGSVSAQLAHHATAPVVVVR